MSSSHENAPNQTAITYRFATHPTFLARMIEQLHQQSVGDPATADQPAARPLAPLTTRDPDDPAIALLDAWAVVGDVLTFYQERIANEGYLRTATEQRSIRELARSTGYELRPGLAASVALAFTVATAPGMDDVVRVDAGIKVQSIPGQDQQPQTFETVETVLARPEWNALTLDSRANAGPGPLPALATGVQLVGTSTGLQPGDPLLIVGAQPEQRYLRTLQEVTLDPQGNFTSITWGEPLPQALGALTAPQLFAFRQRAGLFGHTGWYGIVRYYPEVGWEPLPQALSTRAITALARYQRATTDYLFAGTAGAGIFRSIDNGDSWQPCNAGLANLMVHALCAPVVDGRQLLYAGTTEGAIFCSIDDGDSWAQVSSGSMVEHTKPIYVEHYPPESNKPITTSFTKPKGVTGEYEKWEPMSNGLPRTTIYALAGYTKGADFHLVAATADGLYESIDNGARWSKQDVSERVWALAVGRPDRTEQLFEVRGNTLYRDKQPVDTLDGMRALAFANSTLWIGTDQGIHQLNGNQISSFNAELANPIQALAVRPDGVMFAASPLAPAPGWPTLAISKDRLHLDLDDLYSTLAPNSWVVLIDPTQANLDQLVVRAYQVAACATATHTTLTASPSVTRLTLAAGALLPDFAEKKQQTIAVLAQSEPLALLAEPATLGGLPASGANAQIDHRSLILAGQVPQLPAGRRLLVSGKPPGAAAHDPLIGEVVFVESCQVQAQQTRLTLQAPGLRQRYDPSTVTIAANVALATHGETIAEEVLGSGDGAQANQRFLLNHAPLTYVPAPTATGAASTLTVRVNGVTWGEAPSLHDRQPHNQQYILRQAADGRSYLVFGDGRQGARLPSGTENIVATYRTGLGPAGNVNAHSLSLLQTRPLGVQEVNNPLPASGGAAPEPGDLARQNAPLRVLTMDRLVTLADFEDFARTFAGIELAQATMLAAPGVRLLHLTVAGSNGSAVTADSALYQALVTAINQRRKPTQRIQIDACTLVNFSLTATLYVDARYVPAAVRAAVQQALLAAFAFRQRGFGQPVPPSQAIAVMQATPGVVAVNLTKLWRSAEAAPTATKLKELTASKARWTAQQPLPAELLVIDEQGITLNTVTAL